MSGEEVAFGLDLEGDMAVVAKKMASEMARLEAQIKAVGKATTKTERSFASSKWFDGDNMRRHASYLERSRKAYTSLAPASARAARTLRAFGVSGGWIRKFSTDTAKAEIVLRRLYSIKGGGAKGAAAVVGSLTRRGVGKYGGTVAGGLGSAAMGATKMAGGAALGVGAVAATGAGLLGYSMASTAIEAERVKFALDSITKGQGDKWWDTSADYAKRFGLNVNAVAENLMQMKASGFDDATTNTLFLRMGDLRSLGSSEEKIGRALLAIQQVKAAGRLQGDELNQLSEAGVNADYVYGALSKTLKKTVPEIMKMKEAGKLTSDIVIPAIADAIGTKTGGGAAGAAGEAAAMKTVEGQWGRLKGALSVAATGAVGVTALEPLRSAIETFTAWISGGGGASLINSFGGVISSIFEYAPKVVDKVVWLFDEALPSAFASFSDSFVSSGGAAAFDRLTNAAGALAGEDGTGALTWATNFGGSLGNLVGAMITLVDAAKPLIGLLIKMVEIGMMVPNAIGAVTGFVSSALDTGGLQPADQAANENGGASAVANDNSGFFGVGQNMAQGMAGGLYAGSSGVWDAGAYLAQTAEDAARAQSETHSPSKAWERLATDEADGYIGGHMKSLPSIRSTASTISAASLSSAGSSQPSEQSGSAPNVMVNISIDRSQGEGRSDKEVMELAADIFERRMSRFFGRLAMTG